MDRTAGDKIIGGALVLEKGLIKGLRNLTAPLTIGGSANHTSFELDGTLVSVGNATTWNDLTGQLFPQITSPSLPIETPPDVFTKIYGGTVTGTVADAETFDGSGLGIAETAGANCLTFDFEFTDISKLSTYVYMRYCYRGGSGSHQIDMQVANVSAGAWSGTFTNMQTSFAFSDGNTGTGSPYQWQECAITIPTPSSYFTSANKIKIRINHVSNGTATHYFRVAKIAVCRIVGVPMLEPINSTNIRAMEFPGTDTKITALNGSFELDHRYKEGSNIYPHLHWMPTTNTAGNVKMYLEYTWINAFGTVSTSTTVNFTTSAGGTAWVEKRCNFDNSTGIDNTYTGISGSGKTMAGRFFYRVYRDPNDASDTYPDSILVYDMQIHSEYDTLGSRGVTSK